MSPKNESEYISLREAAKLTDLSQGYLAFLIRQKKLQGKKIGKIWVTKKEWIDEFRKKSGQK